MKKVMLQRPGRVILHSEYLSFVGIGTKKMHIRSADGTPENAQMNINYETLCGVGLTTGLFTQERIWQRHDLCEKCVRSARRYNVERYPEIWIEERQDE